MLVARTRFAADLRSASWLIKFTTLAHQRVIINEQHFDCLRHDFFLLALC